MKTIAEYLVLIKLSGGIHTTTLVPLTGLDDPTMGAADACLVAAERLSVSDHRKIISIRVINVNDMDEILEREQAG